MRILCLTESLGPGGAERQLVKLATQFKENGNSIFFVIYYDDLFYEPILDKANISLIVLQKRSFLGKLILLRRILLQERIDVLISFLISPSFLGICAGFPRKKWKHIVGERGSHGLNYAIRTKLQRVLLFYADIITTNSVSNRLDIIKSNPLIKESRLVVIYNSLNLDIWKPNTYAIKTESRRVIAIAASHKKIKNGLNLIRALNILDQSYRNRVLITWYGRIPDSIAEKKYFLKEIELIERYGLGNIIKLLPETPDIMNHIQSADLLGLFSMDEGLPNAICEGMACGQAILASRVSDLPFFIIDNYNGFLFDPYNINSICSAIKRAIVISDQELEVMGLHNRELALQLFDEKSNFSKFHELIT
jgi:glycosyltransferase involved in cell wall biosynthesis